MPELPGTPPQDDGAPDAALLAATTRPEALAALLQARVFAAVAAAATQERVTAEGLRADSQAELAVLLLEVDGERALPVFSSTDALRRWRLDARPVPLSGADAVRAALDEGAVALLLDPGTERPLVVEDEELAALAEGWLPLPGAPGLAVRPAPPAPRRRRWFARRR